MKNQRVWQGVRSLTYPFPITILVLFPCFVEVLGVETYDGERKDELEKAEDRVEEEGDEGAAAGTISQTHFDQVKPEALQRSLYQWG